MKLKKWIIFAVALTLLPSFARAASNADATLEQIQRPAVFCDGTYALCIKAPCVPVAGPGGTITSAVCSCDVVKGWSMGPGSCPSRQPLRHGSTTHLISTYSNRYNKTETTLTCENSSTVWAWCYGAPCIVNDRDPSKASCNCPVQTSPMRTLGGDCQTDRCDYIWSAATLAADAFANKHFYSYMQKNQPNYPANPPAALCTPSTAK
ncbi:MAG: hypothetical protein K9G60_13620 [Pseudolabrys sp.]|nr:hypothetical protein [Pseudolabrys sp.]